MAKRRILALVLIVLGTLLVFFVYRTETRESRYALPLGLDLSGGTHLVYHADTSKLSGSDIGGAMEALRSVIEKRVNLFGVSEPIVQVERSGILGAGGENRLIVELPGVTDIAEAVRRIGETPLLEFRLGKSGVADLSDQELDQKSAEELFSPTELTGQYLKRAELAFDQTTSEPRVVLYFNSEGEKIFGALTKENVGNRMAIFLDNERLSAPFIRHEITGGVAEISGRFTPTEAKELVRNLNYGALPVPVELVSSQTIGATLGEEATRAGFHAGIWAFIIIALFLILWYRLPGFLAIIALAVYVVLNLTLFKLIPVTLTAAGIAGFILSMGMAVDANILIFERIKEELARGKNLEEALKDGFSRAWLSIRDSNFSSIITAVILYFFAATNIIKGFALVFGIGVLVSMFTAITASRTLLLAMRLKDSKLSRFLFTSGIR